MKKSGVNEGMVLVSAMHITAGVYVNDMRAGLIHDFEKWLENSRRPADYQHHQTGEDNADAHLKRILVHHQVMLPITAARWIWARGSRCSTPSSTASGRSASSSR